MSSRPKLKVDWCSYSAAKYAVEKWHYSGTMPASRRAMLGAWEADEFIGTVIFAKGSNYRLAEHFHVDTQEAAELCRVALTYHQSPVSRILAIAVKLLLNQSPGLRILVSYADTQQGHHGGIYQACGWVYLGKTQAGRGYIVNGKLLHKRAFTGANYGGKTQRLPLGSVPTLLPPKHRYAMPLDDAMRQQLEPLRQPYPKRVRSVASDTPANQTGEGGATPTLTL